MRLWAAQAISAFGSRITRTALPIVAVSTLGQPEAIVGVLAAMQLAPGVILAMVAGGLVDRGHKRRILIGADVARAVLVGSLTLAWALGALSMVHVVVVGAAVGAATALFEITDTAYLPQLIGKHQLAEGNAKLETTDAVAEITGPATAGVLIAALGAPLAVAVDAASYLWSALMLGRIRASDTPSTHPDAEQRAPAAIAHEDVSGPGRISETGSGSPAPGAAALAGSATVSGRSAEPAPPSPLRTADDQGAAMSAETDGAGDGSSSLRVAGAAAGEDDADSAAVSVHPSGGAATGSPREPVADSPGLRTGEDFRIGLRAVFGHPLVRPIVVTLMVWSVTGGFFLALYTPFCFRELGLSEAMFGVVIAMGGVGSLAGAVLSRALARWLGVGRAMLISSLLSLVFTLFIPLAASAPSQPVAIGLLAVHQLLGDAFAVSFLVLAVTLRQTVLPKEVLGRANAAVHVCTVGVLPVFSLLAGGLAALIGIRTAVWAGFLVGLTAPLFLWRLRHLQDIPSGEPAPASTPASTSS